MENKIGAGHLQAYLRAGLKELAQALPAFPSHGIHPVEEPGLFGNLTPQEIVASKGQEQSYEEMLQGYADRGAQAQERQKEQELER
jgi:hypothetical protein